MLEENAARFSLMSDYPGHTLNVVLHGEKGLVLKCQSFFENQRQILEERGWIFVVVGLSRPHVLSCFVRCKK